MTTKDCRIQAHARAHKRGGMGWLCCRAIVPLGLGSCWFRRPPSPGILASHAGSPFPSLCRPPHSCFGFCAFLGLPELLWRVYCLVFFPPRRRELWVCLRRHRRQGLQGVLRGERVSGRRENGFRCPAVAVAGKRRCPRTHHQSGGEYYLHYFVVTCALMLLLLFSPLEFDGVKVWKTREAWRIQR